MSEMYDGSNGESMYQEPQNNESKGLAIASMVLGIVSLVLSCVWYVSIPAAIVGIILGVMHNKKNGKCGMSTAGIACSIISLVLTVLLLVLAAVGLAALGGVAALS